MFKIITKLKSYKMCSQEVYLMIVNKTKMLINTGKIFKGNIIKNK